MPAKTTRKTADAQSDLLAHAEATANAWEWARRAVDWEKAGDAPQARKATRIAKKWLSQAMDIEARYPVPSHEQCFSKSSR